MSTATYKCRVCKEDFIARTADRKRGWAIFCSKSCKAVRQEALTGQHRDYQRAKQASPSSGNCGTHNDSCGISTNEMAYMVEGPEWDAHKDS